MNTKDPTEEAKLVLRIYRYARKNNLDIKDRNNVAEILKTVDPDNFSEDRVDTIMIALQVTAKNIKKDLERRGKIN